MVEKQLCKNCKHLEHDGMFGIFCGVGGNNRNYDCLKFEKKLTDDECGNLLNKLIKENEYLKKHIAQQYELWQKSVKENEQLKIKNKGLESELNIFKHDLKWESDNFNRCYEKLKECEKENEQLKSELECYKALVHTQW